MLSNLSSKLHVWVSESLCKWRLDHSIDTAKTVVFSCLRLKLIEEKWDSIDALNDPASRPTRFMTWLWRVQFSLLRISIHGFLFNRKALRNRLIFDAFAVNCATDSNFWAGYKVLTTARVRLGCLRAKLIGLKVAVLFLGAQSGVRERQNWRNWTFFGGKYSKSGLSVFLMFFLLPSLKCSHYGRFQEYRSQNDDLWRFSFHAFFSPLCVFCLFFSTSRHSFSILPFCRSGKDRKKQ